jgi:phosphoribosylaminoimidazole-succinocarboxamide synthase
LLERQAVRRVREQTLTPEEIERLGTALMRLESTVHELAERHGLDAADLNVDLGPLGTLR